MTIPTQSVMITQVVEMERIVEQGLLYDFYGELLTEHQRRIYEDVVFHDLSASEIAREQGISRQGVHDLVRRCDRILEEYEEKLQLVAKFMKIRDAAARIEEEADQFLKTGDRQRILTIQRLSGEISSTL